MDNQDRAAPQSRDLPLRQGRISLPDGRRLAYAEFGDPAGSPVFLFHGMPGSRLSRPPNQGIVRDLGVRLITVDRPGYGLSDFQPGRRLLDWPLDVTTLADQLGLRLFAIAGVSGGGPYVAACAVSIPHRITGAAIISGAGPMHAPDVTAGMAWTRRVSHPLARRIPWAVRPLLWLLAHPGRNPEKFLARITRGFPPSDLALLADPAIKRVLIEGLAESARRGVRGFAWEAVLLVRPWGFRLEDIPIKVHLWQGEDDCSTPAHMSRYMARAIPQCEATFLPGEGHFVIYRHWKEILRRLLGR